jgi:hypothetical protein
MVRRTCSRVLDACVLVVQLERDDETGEQGRRFLQGLAHCPGAGAAFAAAARPAGLNLAQTGPGAAGVQRLVLSGPAATQLRGSRRLGPRDGNGDPIPDSPRGIHPLGDGDGEETSPTGI